VTVVIPEGLEPLAVWDARCGYHPLKGAAIAWWIKLNLAWDAADVCRVEFYVLDAPFAVVTRHKRNPDGFKFTNPRTSEITGAPVIVPLAELPPAHLLRTP
jgi:hypothetical protein